MSIFVGFSLTQTNKRQHIHLTAITELGGERISDHECVTADSRREAQQHFQCSSFKGRETVIVNQTSIESISKATLGKLLRDRVERIDTILN